jgi:hypothetical protein
MNSLKCGTFTFLQTQVLPKLRQTASCSRRHMAGQRLGNVAEGGSSIAERSDLNVDPSAISPDWGIVGFCGARHLIPLRIGRGQRC